MQIILSLLFTTALFACVQKKTIEANKPEPPKQVLKEKPKRENIIQESSNEFKALLAKSKQAKIPTLTTPSKTPSPNEDTPSEDADKNNELAESDSDKDEKEPVTLEGTSETLTLMDFFRDQYSQTNAILDNWLNEKRKTIRHGIPDLPDISRPTLYQNGKFIYYINEQPLTSQCKQDNSLNCKQAFQLSISTKEKGHLVNIDLNNTTQHRIHFMGSSSWVVGMKTNTRPSSLIRIIDSANHDTPYLSEIFSLDGELIKSKKIGSKLYLLLYFSPTIDGLIFPVRTNTDKEANINTFNNIQSTDVLPWFRQNYGANRCINTRAVTNSEQPTVTYLVEINMASKAIKSVCLNEKIEDSFFTDNAFYFFTRNNIMMTNNGSTSATNKIDLNSLRFFLDISHQKQTKE